MFEPPPDPDRHRALTKDDISSMAVRLTLSAALAPLGPFGAIITEFATQIIPRQRQDRMQQFVEELNDKLNGLQDAFRARLDASPAFSVLTEEVCLSAVRTPSDHRRRDLAELLRDGFTKADADLADSLTLLRVLEGLNEPQLLLLTAHVRFRDAAFSDAEASAFYDRYPALFDVHPPTMSDSEENIRAWAMHQHYLNDLVNKLLLEDTEGMARSKTYRVHVRPTELGIMLIESIGRTV